MKKMILLIPMILLIVGCEESYVRMWGFDTPEIVDSTKPQLADPNSKPIVIDPNSKPIIKKAIKPTDYSIELKGKAADTFAKQLAENIKTVRAMTADVFKKSGILFAGLIITMVGGFIFWGFTGSRFGWVIPAACIAGIAAIIFFVQFSKWIFAGVLIIGGLLLVWKTIEYHNERNVERAKNDK